MENFEKQNKEESPVEEYIRIDKSANEKLKKGERLTKEEQEHVEEKRREDKEENERLYRKSA